MKFNKKTSQRKGIRILDKEENIVSPTLPDILNEIYEGETLEWSILYLEATGNLNEKSIPILEKEIFDSPKGLFISWKQITELANQFFQIKDIILIGSKDESLLLRYEQDQEMYEKCDMVIVMHDSCFWEIFSKDDQFIKRLAEKFKDIKYIESDFQNG